MLKIIFLVYMKHKSRLSVLSIVIFFTVTTYGKTTLEAGRDLIVRYGVNPSYEMFSSIKCPYNKDSEDSKVSAGWFKTLPDGETYEVTVADEKFIRDVAYRRQSLREELRKPNYPISIDGTGMTLQYAYFDDETASCVYFYICDESIHDMNQKMREGALSKMLLKKAVLKNLDAERLVFAYVNIKYVYIGNKSGLTSFVNFMWDELYDYVYEDEK